MASQNLWYRLIFPKDILIFLKIIFDVRLDTIEKHNIKNLSSYSSKVYAFLVLASYVTRIEFTAVPCID